MMVLIICQLLHFVDDILHLDITSNVVEWWLTVYDTKIYLL